MCEVFEKKFFSTNDVFRPIWPEISASLGQKSKNFEIFFETSLRASSGGAASLIMCALDRYEFCYLTTKIILNVKKFNKKTQ